MKWSLRHRRGTASVQEEKDNPTVDPAPYWPNRYFKRLCARLAVIYRSRLYARMGGHLRSEYGVVKHDDSGEVVKYCGFTPPLSYAQWCLCIPQRGFWGGLGILWLLSVHWDLRITVVYADDLREVRVRHNDDLQYADVVIMFQASHYYALGKYRTV